MHSLDGGQVVFSLLKGGGGEGEDEGSHFAGGHFQNIDWFGRPFSDKRAVPRGFF